MKTQKMIDRIIEVFEPGSIVSSDQLYTRCTANQQQATAFFRAFGDLLANGRIEKTQSGYRLNQ